MAALTLETLRNQIRTSIYGRRLGLDQTPDNIAGFGQRGGMLVGVPGVRLPIQTMTTTTPTTMYPSGYIELGATTGSTNTINAPVPGLEVTITQTATSTLGMAVRLTNGNFNSSTGSSANQVTLWGQGVTARFVGLSTAIMASIGGQGQTTAAVSFSTY
jgi:hypothetical protein